MEGLFYELNYDTNNIFFLLFLFSGSPEKVTHIAKKQRAFLTRRALFLCIIKIKK